MNFILRYATMSLCSAIKANVMGTNRRKFRSFRRLFFNDYLLVLNYIPSSANSCFDYVDRTMLAGKISKNQELDKNTLPNKKRDWLK